ncbi:MAG: DUF3102 domain-containing protein [Mesorhizobium sp.]|uniref:DUF3102 domain-containing protein n=1 Tax=unclassified Mesorhizobium TaxID=325217 RepID=UPI000F764A22|nr:MULTISPECIES: DUF3102 domain-containing protein [unclassified Mesorhizobium]AZO75013.1 DUF3102 domain-containing protein [Mesorhizobium sp. M1D.F.Ca.ET.043.01.1.1]RWA96116.1 MAG: DUF3102 domain-containing protein [Mesorhizobium sp.]TJW90395.1 MAG: DUF3102 domain-containing protein [Mesorhizobium sp.]
MNNRLPILAGEIAAEHNAVLKASADFVQHAVAAGHRLIEAKSLVGHGAWQTWLSEQLPDVSIRTAQRYMAAAKRVGKNDIVSFSTLREIIGGGNDEDLDADAWVQEMVRIWESMSICGQERFRAYLAIVSTGDIPGYFAHLDTGTLRKMGKAAAAAGGHA